MRQRQLKTDKRQVSIDIDLIQNIDIAKILEKETKSITMTSSQCLEYVRHNTPKTTRSLKGLTQLPTRIGLPLTPKPTIKIMGGLTEIKEITKPNRKEF